MDINIAGVEERPQSYTVTPSAANAFIAAFLILSAEILES